MSLIVDLQFSVPEGERYSLKILCVPYTLISDKISSLAGINSGFYKTLTL